MQYAAQSDRPPVRGRILEAARERFESFGYRRTGVADIAREAGVAAGTLYRYFKSKEQIFREVFRDSNSAWIETARAALAGPGSGADRLVRLAPASIAFYQKQSLLNAALARDTEIIFAPLLEETRRQVLEQTVAMMADVIRDGIRDGSVRDVDPERTAYVLFTAGQALFNEPDYDYAEVLPVYADLMMRGMRGREDAT